MKYTKYVLQILVLTFVVLGISDVSYSSYVENMGQVSHTINASEWKVSSKVEYQEKNIDNQVFKDFRPGEKKENVIKLENYNDYSTKFYLEIKTQEKLFTNPKITLNIVPLDKNTKSIENSFEWDKIQKNEDDTSTSYFYEVEVKANSASWLNLNIKWDENDDSSIYKSEQGKITYYSRVEKVG